MIQLEPVAQTSSDPCGCGSAANIFSSVPESITDILSTFLQISQIVFQKFTQISMKLQLKVGQIFILVYLNIFLQVSEVFLNFFFDSQIIL